MENKTDSNLGKKYNYFIYNKKAASKALGISVETLDRYKKMGKLPFHQIGTRVLFTENDLTSFLESCAIPAKIIPTAREKTEMAKHIKEGA
jgi:excisionase family DNA binding protein